MDFWHDGDYPIAWSPLINSMSKHSFMGICLDQSVLEFKMLFSLNWNYYTSLHEHILAISGDEIVTLKVWRRHPKC
jgi:hypothetical protein